MCASCAALLPRFRLTAETLVATAAQQSCRGIAAGIAAGSACQDAAPAIHSRFAMNSSANSSALAASIATAAVNSSSATRQGYFDGMGHSCHIKSRARVLRSEMASPVDDSCCAGTCSDGKRFPHLQISGRDFCSSLETRARKQGMRCVRFPGPDVDRIASCMLVAD